MHDPLSAANAAFVVEHVPVDEGVRLRVLRWTPTDPAARRAAPLAFVAGWVSVVDGWRDLLGAVVGQRPVVYIETREKSSAQMEAKRLRPEHFAVERIARDLTEAARALGLNDGRAVFAGSSLGATCVLEALKHDRLKARAAFLIGPNARFRMPWFAQGLFALPASAYPTVRGFVKWYLRTFRVDVRREPEQWARYQATLDMAHPARIKLSAKALAPYAVWPDLETARVPIALAYAASDRLHAAEEIERLTELLPAAAPLPCPSNKYMHSAALAADLETFLATRGIG